MDAQGLKDEADTRRGGVAVREPIAPAPAPREFPTRTVRSLPALSRDERAVYWALTLLWLVVVVRFWAWWLRPEHHGALWLYLAATVPLAYLTTVLPSFYWFFLRRMRRPVHIVPAPGRRVAMITLCVPSHESLDVIAAQLEALTRVRYPHDSWVLDEGGDPDVQALAAEFGVRYFTRKGRPAWNQPGPPFQARTKAGNVNAWLDHVRSSYEIFVQLDVDHRPTPEYLDRTLGYFDDPAVAWVQAPSVCGNLDVWTARGLAEQDLVLQGPLQMGFYGHSRTPFIIGSHTTYRTEAVRGIGGFQPTRAEDHLDTVALAAAGHSGVYVSEIIATGEGPCDFGTYLGQQFAWAYSMVQIFLVHTPRLVRRYTLAQAFQFLMAQSWYTLWSLSLAVLWVLPVVALLTGRAIANVSLLEYLAYNLAVVLTATLMWRWSRRWFQPAGIGLTWRGVLLELARWPIVLWAVINAALRVKRPYMITPKGSRAGAPPPGARLYGPPVLLAEIALGAIAVFEAGGGHAPTQGYLALVLFNLVMVVALLVTALALELRDLRRQTGRLGPVLRWRAGSALAVAAIAISTAAATIACWAPLMEALR
jgi:cellulose synthase/poly-beta-1,6-N-acetylglucosamine synthase-like glycosyltransferase